MGVRSPGSRTDARARSAERRHPGGGVRRDGGNRAGGVRSVARRRRRAAALAPQRHSLQPVSGGHFRAARELVALRTVRPLPFALSLVVLALLPSELPGTFAPPLAHAATDKPVVRPRGDRALQSRLLLRRRRAAERPQHTRRLLAWHARDDTRVPVRPAARPRERGQGATLYGALSDVAARRRGVLLADVADGDRGPGAGHPRADRTRPRRRGRARGPPIRRDVRRRVLQRRLLRELPRAPRRARRQRLHRARGGASWARPKDHDGKRAPVFVGVSARDSQTAEHSRALAGTLAALHWPYRVEERNVGHLVDWGFMAHGIAWLRGRAAAAAAQGGDGGPPPG